MEMVISMRTPLAAIISQKFRAARLRASEALGHQKFDSLVALESPIIKFQNQWAIAGAPHFFGGFDDDAIGASEFPEGEFALRFRAMTKWSRTCPTKVGTPVWKPLRPGYRRR
jgi:hypothetical protein